MTVSKTQIVVNTNFPQVGFEHRALGQQAGVLPIEPPLLVVETIGTLTSIPYTKYGTLSINNTNDSSKINNFFKI